MKFIADVNVAQVVITYLHQSGHDVVDSKKQFSKKADIDIIKLALRENRIILTHDKDFLGLAKLKQLLEEDTEEVLVNSLTILTEDSIEHYPYKDRMVISKSNF